MKAPIAVALDAPNLSVAKQWAKEVSPFVSTLKIGLETYLRDGKDSIQSIREISDCDVFLDLKLHDIPATVAGACKSVLGLNPKYLTVHASGGICP
jgi:orotidine-5'-phosphate decarboxylase